MSHHFLWTLKWLQLCGGIFLIPQILDKGPCVSFVSPAGKQQHGQRAVPRRQVPSGSPVLGPPGAASPQSLWCGRAAGGAAPSPFAASMICPATGAA